VAAPISNDLFRDFLRCKFKAHLKISGKCGQKSDYEKLDTRRSDEYRRIATDHLLRSRPNTEICQNPTDLPKALRHGYAIVIAGQATIDNTSVHFDALLLATPRPASSTPGYSPVLFSRAQKLSKEDGLLAAFCGIALERLQGQPVDQGRVIHGESFAVSRVAIAKLIPTVKKVLRELADLEGSPPLRLNSHCSICEFKRECHAAAVEKDDLSLLRGLKPKELIKLNSKGIFTVTQYSYTFRPRRRRKKGAKVPVKHDHALQALAIRTNTIYVASKPSLPSTATRLYLDVESIPDRDFYYLIGVTVCNETQTHHSFWADELTDEATIWNSFLTLAGTLPTFTLCFYGSYESRWLKMMHRRHGGDKTLIQALQSHSCNVLSAIYGHIYFPTHANDLKSIASYMGFGWSSPDASGVQSIAWRQKWEMDELQATKDELLRYNQEDCLALQVVTHTLERICDNNSASSAVPSNVISTDDLKREHPYGFGRNPFFFPELERINRCAYFAYQRERVYVRTNDAIKRTERRKEQSRPTRHRANTEIIFPVARVCPFCNGTHVIKHVAQSHRVHDLRLTKSGVKRWIVRYVSKRAFCKECGKSFPSKEYYAATRSQFGPTLLAWTVYHNILLLQSHGMIRQQLADLFGYSLRADIGTHLKKVAAQYYESTYQQLIQAIRQGNLVLVDETKASIKGVTGYVWAFTNLETVVYVYTNTREGDLLPEMLGGFQGVLVSDFYAAYDSVPCRQQKCLVHLMRDINDDLFKNPFDQELKDLAREFTATLGPIVETIDKYGLKRLHLHKHKAGADRFIRNVLERSLVSDIAKGYQNRLRKNQDTLFTFLDFDGVPWNNNNAEHAIKRFAFLRRVIGGSSTERGIKDYLILLSICETLRLRGASFLKFLISQELDIDEFVRSYR
jgi:predicted RecB family nuclease